MHLKQPGYIYSACGQFTKNKERIFEKKQEIGDIYQNELDKACFQHDMASREFKDLNRRAPAVKVLSDKTFSIAKDPNYDGYQCRLVSVVFKFFDKKTSGSSIKKENSPNKELAEELHKLTIKNVNKRLVHASFFGNICGADLADA